MTNEAARDRRERIAEYVASGKTVGEASARFEVSINLVYNACAEHKVVAQRAATSTKPRTFQILRDLWDGKSACQVAKDHGVSRVFVFKIKRSAGDNGWPELRSKRAKITA